MELATIVAQNGSLKYLEHDRLYGRSCAESRSREASDSMWVCVGNQVIAWQHSVCIIEKGVLSSEFWAANTEQ